MKILIVEDNPELAGNINDYLGKEGYICECANGYHESLSKIHAYDYDCIVLDIMLPDGNGLELLRHIKQEKIKSGILIISAKNALDDRIAGLELGADDYLTKPFHLSELNARLRAIYRRKYTQGDRFIEVNEININTDSMEIKVNNNLLDLTKKEYALFLYFVINQNRVLTRQSIAEHLWGDYVDNLMNFDFVYQHVKNLRKKIIEAKGHDYIETIYGLGYKFNTNKA